MVFMPCTMSAATAASAVVIRRATCADCRLGISGIRDQESGIRSQGSGVRRKNPEQKLGSEASNPIISNQEEPPTEDLTPDSWLLTPGLTTAGSHVPFR